MFNLFEVIDKKGRKVILSQESWSHILRHKGMEQHLDNIKKAISNPTINRLHIHDPNKENFYLYFKEAKHYLLVQLNI